GAAAHRPAWTLGSPRALVVAVAWAILHRAPVLLTKKGRCYSTAVEGGASCSSFDASVEDRAGRRAQNAASPAFSTCASVAPFLQKARPCSSRSVHAVSRITSASRAARSLGCGIVARPAACDGRFALARARQSSIRHRRVLLLGRCCRAAFGRSLLSRCRRPQAARHLLALRAHLSAGGRVQHHRGPRSVGRGGGAD